MKSMRCETEVQASAIKVASCSCMWADGFSTYFFLSISKDWTVDHGIIAEWPRWCVPGVINLVSFTTLGELTLEIRRVALVARAIFLGPEHGIAEML